VPEGQGPLVVLLHGWPQTWYLAQGHRRLAAEHTVLAPDLRGYGFSDKPPAGYDKWLGHRAQPFFPSWR
jgi:haloacetate dehalogenase